MNCTEFELWGGLERLGASLHRFISMTERIFDGMKGTDIRAQERVRKLRYIWTRWRKVDLRSWVGNLALL